ncbi:MAG: DeoR/GlpR family DNA-binding transcription regulator [Spirochaetota bacterium]
MTANLSEREKEVLRLLSEDNNLTVAHISHVLEVSRVTIRSDLNSLAEKGFIVRTRGGAFPAFHPNILDRQKHMVEVKNRIAQRAASFVEDGDTIMIEAGTTTALVAKYLLGKRDIHIVTNSTLIIPYARINPSINLTVVGGEFRPITESLVGTVALHDLEQFHVKYAFVGTDGFSIETGLTTHLTEGAEIVRKMAQQAETTVLVADSSKYGKMGFALVLPVSELDTIITDTKISFSILKSLEEGGTSVIAV